MADTDMTRLTVTRCEGESIVIYTPDGEPVATVELARVRGRKASVRVHARRNVRVRRSELREISDA